MKKNKGRSKATRGARESLAYKTLLAREPEFRGKYVVIIDNQVFAAKTGKQAARILAKVRKNFPGKIPLATYLPKEGTLILWQ